MKWRRFIIEASSNLFGFVCFSTTTRNQRCTVGCPTCGALSYSNIGENKRFSYMLLVSLNVRRTENSAGWTTYGTFLVVVLESNSNVAGPTQSRSSRRKVGPPTPVVRGRRGVDPRRRIGRCRRISRPLAHQDSGHNGGAGEGRRSGGLRLRPALRIDLPGPLRRAD